MNRRYLITCAAIAMSSTLVVAQDAPESLLPPGFENPAPTPTPAPTPRADPRPTPSPTPAPRPSTGSGQGATVQPIPSSPPPPPVSSRSSSISRDIPDGLPSLRELENLDPDELDRLLGLKPKFDIPPAARRSLSEIGILAPDEGGLPTGSLGNQPAILVRASLAGIKGPLVSRWGHILLRRAMVSRLDAPGEMDPVEFAALRVAGLNRMGEHAAARAVAQDVDTANWNADLLTAALDAYLATSDIVGACPAVQVKGDLIDTPQWNLVKDICYAFTGQNGRSQANLNRAFRGDAIPDIDVLLAQRYAGTAGRGRRAINLEWDDVDELTPWRFGLANALGAELPDGLLDDMRPYYANIAATAPMLDLSQRARNADLSAQRGNLSATAMVDLYSQLHVAGGADTELARTASRLRQAYVAPNAADRVAAIRDVWGGSDRDYARLVLTAYAAARVTPNAALAEHADDLIASMLTAGLDADAQSWANVVSEGSIAWALLALSNPQSGAVVDEGDVDDFIDNDGSGNRLKSKFLVAGLAGLGRLDDAARADLSDTVGTDLVRRTKWSRLIERAAQVRNQPLVAYLAAVGMQGSDWDRMTPRHLYHIVSALNRVGLNAEARMIAAEAVARG